MHYHKLFSVFSPPSVPPFTRSRRRCCFHSTRFCKTWRRKIQWHAKAKVTSQQLSDGNVCAPTFVCKPKAPKKHPLAKFSETISLRSLFKLCLPSMMGMKNKSCVLSSLATLACLRLPALALDDIADTKHCPSLASVNSCSTSSSRWSLHLKKK